MPSKKRLDVLVYEAGFADSREKAKAIIMSGIIYVDGQKSDKPGTSYNEDVKLEMRGEKPKYVSRGGLKLEKAVSAFSLDLKDNGEAVCLIKPQFEAGRGNVGKNGVVRDKSIHAMVIRKIYDYCLENGFDVMDADFSPIKGPEGNIEYLIYIRKSDEPKAYKEIDIDALVELSHKTLDK